MPKLVADHVIATLRAKTPFARASRKMADHDAASRAPLAIGAHTWRAVWLHPLRGRLPTPPTGESSGVAAFTLCVISPTKTHVLES